jgi:hypothetical protein
MVTPNAEYVTVRRDDLISVIDSLAEVANERGQMHDGLTHLIEQVYGVSPTDGSER